MSEKRFKVSGHATDQCQGVINYSVGGLSGNYPDISFTVTVKAGWYSYVAGHGIAYNGSKFAWTSETKTANVNWRSTGAQYSPWYAQKTYTVKLGNARSASRSVSLSVTTYSPYNFSGSITATSASIPAPSSYSLSVSSITEKSVVINHVLGNQRGYWRVRLRDNNSGATWNLNSNTGNGSTTISGLSPNTAYSFVVQVLDRNNNVCYTSGAVGAMTLGISHIGNNPTFTLGSAFTLVITGYSDSFTHDATFTVGSYSFSRTGLRRGNVTITPTAAEVDAMYTQFATKDDIRMTIHLNTYANGSMIGFAGSYGYVKINIDVAKPVVTGFSYEDIVAAAIALTGNKQHVIQNISQIRVSGISASGKKGATIKSYQLIVGSRTTGSTSITITDTGVITSNSGITVKAIDSRGLEGVRTVGFAGYYAYNAPRLSLLEPRRRNSIEAATYLKMAGNWTPLTVGTEKKNNSCAVSWCYKKTSDSSFGAYADIQAFADGSISYENIVGSLDPESSYNIRVRLVDALATTTFDTLISKGTPDFSICKDGAAFGKIAESKDTLEIAWLLKLLKDLSILGNASVNGTVTAGALVSKSYLHSQNSYGNTQIGSINASCCHYVTSTPCHWFDHPVKVQGDVYGGSSYNRRLMYADESHNHSYTTWIGSQYSTTGLLGFYSANGGGSRKGWIGHNGGTDFNIINEAGGKLMVNTSADIGGAGVRLSNTGASRAVYATFSDGANHDILSIGSNNLDIYCGAADIGREQTSNFRGKYVKLYNHSGGYCRVNGAAITSDKNLKYDITDCNPAFERFFMALKPRAFKYETGTAKRDHIGFIAQEVEESLSYAGMTTDDFAGVIIHKNIMRSEDDTDMNLLLDKDIHEMHLLRMEEFIALNTHMLQKAYKRIDDLEERVVILEKLLEGK